MTSADRLWRLPAVVLLGIVCMSPWRLEARPAPVHSTEPVQVTLPAVPVQPVLAQPTPQAVPSPPGVAVPEGPPAPAPVDPAALLLPTPQLPLRPQDFPRGQYHLVRPGEDATSVAALYGVASRWTIYDANPFIVRPTHLPVGSWLYIPHPSLAPARRPRPDEPGWSPVPSTAVIVDQVWLDLAGCESSGDWGIDSGNGYYGGLQFLPSSWEAVGGQGWPHHAHPMEQIARADALQRIQGWKAWPVCSVKLGLRAPDDSGAAATGPAEPAGGAPAPSPSDAPTDQP